MASRRRSRSRVRVGKVSVYLHHGAWWLYYRENGKPVRRRVGLNREDAERIAAQVNAQVMNDSPTLLSYEPIGVAELRQRFLDYHEHVINSSLGTVRRYRAATRYLVSFVEQMPRQPRLHEIRPDSFVIYLRGSKWPPTVMNIPPGAGSGTRAFASSWRPAAPCTTSP